MAKIIKVNGYKGDVLYIMDASQIVSIADIRKATKENGDRDGLQDKVQTLVRYKLGDSNANIASIDPVEDILSQIE